MTKSRVHLWFVQQVNLNAILTIYVSIKPRDVMVFMIVLVLLMKKIVVLVQFQEPVDKINFNAHRQEHLILLVELFAYLFHGGNYEML